MRSNRAIIFCFEPIAARTSQRDFIRDKRSLALETVIVRNRLTFRRALKKMLDFIQSANALAFILVVPMLIAVAVDFVAANDTTANALTPSIYELVPIWIRNIVITNPILPNFAALFAIAAAIADFAQIVLLTASADTIAILKFMAIPHPDSTFCIS